MVRHVSFALVLDQPVPASQADIIEEVGHVLRPPAPPAAVLATADTALLPAALPAAVVAAASLSAMHAPGKIKDKFVQGDARSFSRLPPECLPEY